MLSFIIVVVGNLVFVFKYSKLLTFVITRFYTSVFFPYSLFRTPEVGLCQLWNSAKAEYFKNKNFMLRKPD